IVQLRIQPPDLRAIMRLAIKKALGDAVFDTAYLAVKSSVAYHRKILYQSAKSLHLSLFAKRFNLDHEIGKAFGRVLGGRVSAFRGRLKRITASKVEGFYQLLEGPECVEKIRVLIQGSTYIYPTKEHTIVKSKPFSHPVIIAVLREAFFANIRGGSSASKYHGRFESSLPDSRPTELEIPSAMLALVATTLHSALDDYSTGICKKTDFNADLYEDVYTGHCNFLSHIREGSITKYHRLMSDLYNRAS
ncbi:hypothetical protein EDB85DRAFT_1862189, partial [Lactarius pseudohatsudake]